MKILKPGRLIRWHGQVYDIKEYVSHGLYQANEADTGRLVYIPREEMILLPNNKVTNKQGELTAPPHCSTYRVVQDGLSYVIEHNITGEMLMRDAVTDPRRHSKNSFYVRRWKTRKSAEAFLSNIEMRSQNE